MRLCILEAVPGRIDVQLATGAARALTSLVRQTWRWRLLHPAQACVCAAGTRSSVLRRGVGVSAAVVGLVDGGGRKSGTRARVLVARRPPRRWRGAGDEGEESNEREKQRRTGVVAGGAPRWRVWASSRCGAPMRPQRCGAKQAERCARSRGRGVGRRMVPCSSGPPRPAPPRLPPVRLPCPHDAEHSPHRPLQRAACFRRTRPPCRPQPARVPRLASN